MSVKCDGWTALSVSDSVWKSLFGDVLQLNLWYDRDSVQVVEPQVLSTETNSAKGL